MLKLTWSAGLCFHGRLIMVENDKKYIKAIIRVFHI